MTVTQIRRVAHDPGDPMITSHCPFCGSGQISGRSDGLIECGFCGMAYIVRVQPAFAGMPQQPGMGAPTDTGPELLDPAMVGPDGMPLGGDPMEDPMAEGELPPDAGMEEDGEEADGAAPPWAGDEDEEHGGGEDEAPPSKSKGKGSGSKSGPAGKDKSKKKGSIAVPHAGSLQNRQPHAPAAGADVPGVPRYRSAGGHLLSESNYVRHLAVLCSGASPQVIARLSGSSPIQGDETASRRRAG
jgi:hypothetical protein